MYLIKTIKQKELVDYLLNLFERSFTINHLIYQKYEVDNLEGEDDPVDELYVLDDNNGSYVMAAIIDYGYKEIFVKESYCFNSKEDDGNHYKPIHRLKWKISDRLNNYIDASKELKKKEIEEHPKFISFYESHKKEYFQEFVNVALKISCYMPIVANNIQNSITEYAESLTLEELRNAYHKKFDKMYEFADDLLFSDEFLSVLSFEKVKEEAMNYVKSGKLSKNDQRSKACLEAIENCRANRFTVVDIHGNRVSCSNYVHINAMLKASGPNDYNVYLYDIEQIIYKGKKIYQAV